MPKLYALNQNTYSFRSSSIASSVIPSKSWLSMEHISGAVSDAQNFPALSARSESSWKRSTIFRIPHPGWVGEGGFLFIERRLSMSPLRLFRKLKMSLTLAFWVSPNCRSLPSRVRNAARCSAEQRIHPRSEQGLERNFDCIRDYQVVKRDNDFEMRA